VINSQAATLLAEESAEDWKEKFLKEVDDHYYSIQKLKADIESRDVEMAQLQEQVSDQALRIKTLEKQLDPKQ